MSNVIQNILIIVGLIIVALLGVYLYLQQSGQSLSIPSFSNEPSVATIQSQEFIAQLQRMKSISLDANAVFADEHFQSLVEFSRPIRPESVGRANPFAPRD